MTLLAAGVFLDARAQEASAQNGQPWTLQACIDHALSHNISLHKSRVAAAETAVDLKTARAALFPDLSFSSGHSVVNRPYQETTNSIVSGSNIISTGNRTSYTGSYGLNASWTLYNGGRLTNTVKQEKLNTRVADLEVSVSENSIRESIAQLYMQILYASEAVAINESTVGLSAAQLERGRRLLEAGSIAKSDLAQLEAQADADRYQLVSAQTTLQEYKLQLKQLLELDGEEEMNIGTPDLDDADVLVPLPAKRDVYAAALTHRPEIESRRLSIEAADLGIRIARAGYLPTVSLSAGIGTNHATGGTYSFARQLKNGWSNSVGVTLSVPIFNNRQTKSAVEKAKLSLQTGQLSLLEEQKTLYKSIETLWQNANSAQQKYAAAVTKLKSAQAGYDLVAEKFAMGMKNTVELLTEKNNLVQAQQEQLQSKYTALVNLQLLKFYQGETLSL